MLKKLGRYNKQWHLRNYKLYHGMISRDRKEIKFLNLKQGSMTVVEYERKFNQLSRYVPYLVGTEGKKARRLESGLRHEIASILASLDLPTYADESRQE